MLALRLELLTGRYVASEYNNRNRAEWPPHPARVFSALVAAYYEGGMPPAGKEALRWLEAQPAPALCFSAQFARRDVKTHFVPVNDKALSDSAEVQRAWSKVYAAQSDQARAKSQRAASADDKQAAKADKAVTKAQKTETKAEAGLTKAYAKMSSEDEKLGKTFKKAVAHVLPATRTKQPRTFPAVTPEDPVVHLVWQDLPSAEVRAGLDAIAASLVRVGHSSSLVAACWVEDAPEPTWVPAENGGELLRWVRPGQLDALDALHDAAPFGERRVMPYTVARYGEARRSRRVASSCFANHFIVLRRVAGPRLPLEATESVADAVRRALMSHAEEPVASLISGHAQQGRALEADHLAVVPLPYVGGGHGTGELLGVALIPPAGLGLEDLRPLYTAIAAWEGAPRGKSDQPQARLNLGRMGALTLERCLDLPSLYNLRESTWTRASTTWASATPVVLDRHPGSLRKDRGRAVAKATATLSAACERIGLPPPREVEISTSPFFRGSVPAKSIRRRSSERPDPRPCVHVRLTFDEAVSGPVLLGAARYRGLGLFRPIDLDPQEAGDA